MVRIDEGRTNDPVIRRVTGEGELRDVFAFLAPLFSAEVRADDDFRLDRLLERLVDDQDLMLVAVAADDTYRGAALGYREGSNGVKLQALAVAPEVRRRGIASRLLAESASSRQERLAALRAARTQRLSGQASRPEQPTHG